MDCRAILTSLDKVAERANPIKPGDWRDQQGLLHCGKCGAFMEHIVTLDKIKVPQAFYEGLDSEHRQYVDDARNWLAGRKHRIQCRCKEEERRAFEKAQRKQTIDDNMKHCFGRTPALFNYVFELDDNKQSKASETSRKYAIDFKKYCERGWKLILHGKVGTGKTYYACAIANKLLQDGYKVKFTTITDIIADAKRYFLPISTVVDGLCENHLVVIDDFGSENQNEKTIADTYQIINSFYERKQALVVTTNIPYDTLKNPTETETQRIYSRLLKDSTLLEVTSDGDRRQK